MNTVLCIALALFCVHAGCQAISPAANVQQGHLSTSFGASQRQKQEHGLATTVHV